MIFLPTCGRPREVTELIEAYQACGETAPVLALIDDAMNERRESYEDIAWPQGWSYVEFSEHHELTRLLNMGLRMYPGEKCYGFFGDHFRPLTPFAAALEEAAGDWFIAWPSDGESSDKQPAGAPHFGGKLVAALGWIMLPGTFHCCTDRVWWLLWRELGIVKHVETVRFTRTWPVGHGSVPRVYRGRDVNAHDFAAWQAWERGWAPSVVEKIRAAMQAEGYIFGADGRIDPRYGCTEFKPGW
jgi:hypothetical protein